MNFKQEKGFKRGWCILVKKVAITKALICHACVFWVGNRTFIKKSPGSLWGGRVLSGVVFSHVAKEV